MPNPPPKPQRLRVLTRETAQARSVNQPSPSPPPNSNSPNASPEADATYSSIPKPKRTRPPFFSSLLTTLRARFAALPPPIRRTARVLRYVAPLVPIGMFFSEHVMQVVWVRGASMAPFLNENYETTHTRSDMVLVSMWPGAMGWSWWAKAAEREKEKEKEGQRRRRMMERGMVVTFRYASSISLPGGPRGGLRIADPIGLFRIDPPQTRRTSP
jgi:inner membrane protease subunit 2